MNANDVINKTIDNQSVDTLLQTLDKPITSADIDTVWRATMILKGKTGADFTDERENELPGKPFSQALKEISTYYVEKGVD